ncbi:MAG TPA: BsuPI-related putative proteinase inhibitor [Gammaproteobacteria bacterium]
MRMLFLIPLTLLAGCTANAGGDSAAAPAGKPVHMEVRIENAAGSPAKNFTHDDMARFVFVLRNDSATPLRLGYTFPPHRITITPAGGGEPVWQAFHGRMFPQVMRHQELPAGETARFSVEWDFHHAGMPGKAVPPGSYLVQPAFIAFLQPGNHRLDPGIEPVTITLAE